MKSIRRSYFISSFLIASVMLIILAVVYFYQTYRNFEDEAEKQRIEYVKSQKEIIRHEVNCAIDFIEFNKAKIADRVKAGENPDDVKKEIQNDIVRWIQGIKFNEGGYVFLSSYDGIVLVHHRPEHIGKNLWDLTDPNGVKIHQTILEAGTKPGGGYMEYIGTKNPVTGKPGKKITFSKSIDDWKWLVGSGFYIDNIEPVIAEKREQLAERVKSQIIYAILIFLIAAGLATLIINSFSQRIRRQIDLLAGYFQRSATTYEKVDKDQLPYEEFKALSDSINRMVDEHKRAGEVLRKSEQKYRLLADNTMDCIWQMNLEFEFTYVNPPVLQMFGFTQDEWIGSSLPEHCSTEDLEFMAGLAMEELKKGAESTGVVFETQLLHKNGRNITVEITSKMFFDDDGNPVAFQGSTRDITERRQTEEELVKHRGHLEELVREHTSELEKRVSEVEQINSAMVNLMEDLRTSNESLEATTRQLANTNKELEAFSYSVSHDLRAPLRTADGFSQILMEEYSDILDEKAKHYIERVRAGAQNMAQLIDDILNLSRIGRQSMKKKKINMETIAGEVYNSMEDKWKGRKVDFTVHHCPIAHGDPHLMRIVFMNLLSNALKFTRNREEAEIEVGCEIRDEQTVFFVKDNGAGFDMKYADKLFVPFQRLHRKEEYEGSGIGLAIVQRIIHRHSGQIWVESKQDKGTTFYFTLVS